MLLDKYREIIYITISFIYIQIWAEEADKSDGDGKHLHGIPISLKDDVPLKVSNSTNPWTFQNIHVWARSEVGRFVLRSELEECPIRRWQLDVTRSHKYGHQWPTKRSNVLHYYFEKITGHKVIAWTCQSYHWLGTKYWTRSASEISTVRPLSFTTFLNKMFWTQL